ncbi:putative aldouronate transport system permease protein [Paenibacillus endophyticus]|uniref:Putative aldouronate transport system permease protein n=1 Tax=Paenibacillus endophyticus TaxID=1294268 RepID=A0A7W5GAE4_9BACL|nr:carbohydrate ABC transporter permease [Paenibacillus endophyticus]MBB3151872.1 putative aldouronate transport system permease protein [Paenibacillus endophyticus]
MLKLKFSNRMFQYANHLFLSIVAILCILPMIHVLAVSLSSNYATTSFLVKLWPIGFTWDAYEKALNSNNFLVAFKVSILRTVFGTLISMTLTMLAAYSMSKDNRYFRGRTVYAWFFVFTMLFHGGLIPTYLVVQKAGLMNSLWALILPVAVNVFNVVLMMNFFRGIPKELEEAAAIDGAGHFRVLFTIFFPISLPSIATLSLFTMVFHWNSWFDGMIYMNQANKIPLATFLQALIAGFDYTQIGLNPSDLENLSERSLKSALIFIGTLPILLVYPFLQKYFVKGMTLGSVKE